jgi:dsDNA-specific endonuclease/ATPase MutS2
LKESKKLVAPLEKEISVNAVKFYKEKSFSKNDFFEGNAMVFDLVTNPLKEEIDKLTEKDFKKIVNEKDKENRPVETEKKVQAVPEILEVDLHIEELIDIVNGLSNREILDIQMDKFQREMELAIKNRVKRVVFIHGVGNGVLKQEIAKRLSSKYARFQFQDASFKEYGFGATMVILRRK